MKAKTLTSPRGWDRAPACGRATRMGGGIQGRPSPAAARSAGSL